MKEIRLKVLTGKSSFWIGYSVSILGRFIHGMALSWVVWSHTQSPLWLSAIALLSALPSLPLAPIAGQVADRFHRHRILLVTQTLGCSVATLTAVLAWMGLLNPYVLAILALCFGIITSIDGPALHSMLVESGETVSEAVARQSLIMNIARSVAPMIAVGIIEAVGSGFCFLANAVAFLPMIYIMAVVRIPNRTTEVERKQSLGMTSKELFLKYQVLKDVLPQVGCLSIFIMPAVALLPAISLKDAELVSFGSMSSGLGFGAVAAAVLIQKNKKIIDQITTVWLGGWICCIAFAVLPALTTIESQWLCALVAGGALTFAFAASNNAIQKKAPNMYRGRFSALYLAVMLGLVPIGQLIVGLSAQFFGSQASVRACSMIAMILMVLFAYLSSTGSHAKENDSQD